MEDYLSNGKNIHDDKWTRSIAVGNEGFIDRVKSMMGVLAIGRKNIGAKDGYQLREPAAVYNTHFEGEKYDIGVENTYLWDV